MQDRYVGDIGDFVKLAILRALMPDHRLGVAWWMYPDENHNGDGRHIGYLGRPDEWRFLDPELFDGLTKIVEAGDRRVLALQDAGSLPGAVFSDEIIPIEGPVAQRRAGRLDWFMRVRAAMTECDLVFIDPDNGLEPANFSAGAKAGGKSVSMAELNGLRTPSRTLIVYHHQTRRKGGHVCELAHWAERLRGEGFQTVDAIRSRPYSARAFFLLNAAPDIRERATAHVTRWAGLLSWHPDARSAP